MNTEYVKPYLNKWMYFPSSQIHKVQPVYLVVQTLMHFQMISLRTGLCLSC